ncbi:dihydrofolate reductase family protein [Sorangium sp. So ce131]|uniref:dihydrofolate reductase family protein n=1 Tax=Sorangium sp. So ce131 TaxID=3133282 RepID=UPI003F5DB6E3
MRKLKYHVATTIDGFIARSDGSPDIFPFEGDHVPDFTAALRSYDAVVMGRRTYEYGLNLGVTDPYPWMDTYVMSRTMKESPNPRVKVVSEDGPGVVRRLKEQQGGDIYLCGGGELATALLHEGLVDEVILKVNPLLLGEGVALAPGLRAVTSLELLSTKVHRNGVVVVQYAVRR